MAIIIGNATDQVLRGTTAADSIYRDAAGQVLVSRDSRLLSRGGLLGLGGTDYVVGDAGGGMVAEAGAMLTGSADTLWGGAGNDVLDGEAGDDTLIGGAGNDTIWDDQGGDRIAAFGGVVRGGNDVFVLDPENGRGNVIMDLEGGEGTELGVGDRLDVRGFAFADAAAVLALATVRAATPSSTWASPPVSPGSASPAS